MVRDTLLICELMTFNLGAVGSSPHRAHHFPKRHNDLWLRYRRDGWPFKFFQRSLPEEISRASGWKRSVPSRARQELPVRLFEVRLPWDPMLLVWCTACRETHDAECCFTADAARNPSVAEKGLKKSALSLFSNIAIGISSTSQRTAGLNTRPYRRRCGLLHDARRHDRSLLCRCC